MKKYPRNVSCMNKSLENELNILKEELERIAILHNFNFQHPEVLDASRKLDKLIVEILASKSNNRNGGDYHLDESW